MYFIIYKTTNLINGKIYVGAHKTENLEDDYLGSGKYLNNAILKYGRENFSKDIIAICDTEEEMYKLEESLVCESFLLFFSTYNLKLGGEGGFDHINKNRLSGFCNTEIAKKGRRLTDEILRSKGISKRDLSIKGAKACKEKKVGIYNPNYKHKGFPHKESSKKLMSEKMKISSLGNKNALGLIWINNGLTRKRLKKDKSIPEGWKLGFKYN